ncbi:hypothetical protein Tco_0645132, partial [Tanacetum coccineum]
YGVGGIPTRSWWSKNEVSVNEISSLKEG